MSTLGPVLPSPANNIGITHPTYPSSSFLPEGPCTAWGKVLSEIWLPHWPVSEWGRDPALASSSPFLSLFLFFSPVNGSKIPCSPGQRAGTEAGPSLGPQASQWCLVIKDRWLKDRGLSSVVLWGCFSQWSQNRKGGCLSKPWSLRKVERF